MEQEGGVLLFTELLLKDKYYHLTFMLRILFLFFLITLGQFRITAQHSLKEFIELKNESCYSIPFQKPYTVIIKDKRNFSTNAVNYEAFQNYLLGFFEMEDVYLLDIEKVSNFEDNKIEVEIEFFNFSTGSTNEAILKFIASININGGAYFDINEKISISTESFTDISINKLDSKRNKPLIDELINNFSIETAKKIHKAINEKTINAKANTYEIVSLGYAKIDNNSQIDKSKEAALLDALLKGAEKTFGISVNNESKIIDYGDVSDVVTSNVKGNVIYHEILNDELIITKDQYLCLVVKSIMKK